MKTVFALAVALLLISGGALATETGAGTLRADDFNSLDKDDDGYIGEDEMKGNKELSSQLKKLDTDEDGSLSESEFGAFEAQRGATESASDRSPED